MAKGWLSEIRRDVHNQIAARLRQARLMSGLSQSDAARIIGVTYQQYNKYEMGTNRVSAVTLHRLAVAFDVSDIGWFFNTHTSDSTLRESAHPSKILHLFAEIENRADQKLLLAIASRLAPAKHSQSPQKSPSAADRMAPRSGALLDMRGKHVLLVDDDPDALRVTETFVVKAGLRVTVALNGDEALARMASGEKFDALVTDYAMPGLSGLALIDLAREIVPSLPLLVVTGYSRDIDLLMGLPPHVQVLVKPFTRELFLEAIAQIIVAPSETNHASP